jgi:alkanesulfonate monooxygenase SsuD/methylene tetrahydromethanopterin reductase-like flavin-dependent oxidoreductase (luciferase family)
MLHGLDVPNYGDYFDPRVLADLAHEAEQSGWDGFFLWDTLWAGVTEPMADPWVALAAIAMRTERIRIGPMVTPLPRRRPWKLARETVSIDHLSGGRLILGVGLGSPPDTEFEQFGEDGDTKVRAVLLDEGLDVLTGLWSGEPFSYSGDRYRLRETVFAPRPVQTPRIPIWVGGVWPNKAPLRRAARWDGVFPIFMEDNNDMTPAIMKQVVAYTAKHRQSNAPFDVVASGKAPGNDLGSEAALAAAFADAGATWFVTSIGPALGSVEDSRARIRRGPPRA